MSDFSVTIRKIDSVYDHPDADRLSLNKIGGFVAISNKIDGNHRYMEGQLIAYIPEFAILPHWLMKNLDLVDENDKGLLEGKNNDRVKIRKLRGIFSQGIILPLEYLVDGTIIIKNDENSTNITVHEGDDIAAFLGIKKYEPEIPSSLAGEVFSCLETVKYDFESIQKYPDIFDNTDIVQVTEKLHGSFVSIGYIPSINENDSSHSDDYFGETKTIYITSKGLGNQNLALKNNEINNQRNGYVRVLTKHLADGLEEAFIKLSSKNEGQSIRIFAELFGKGIQDLGYGLDKPELRIFDIMIGDKFIDRNIAKDYAENILNIPFVPVLYEGPYDIEKLTAVRDGKDNINGTNIREGIVIVCVPEKRHDHHGRKIGKFVSPHYLMRKGGTEFN